MKTCSPVPWLFFFGAAVLPAAVTQIRVTERSDVADLAYERIVARVHFAVDPALAANRIVRDLELAPRNAAGQVEFSADLYVLKPRDPAKGNGTLLFEVSNRGRKGLLSMFNLARSSPDPRTAADLGDRYLMEQGYTLVWLGWQWDVPEEPGAMRIELPRAMGVRGLVRAEWVADKPVKVISLADRTMIAYPVANPSDPKLTLTVRDLPASPRKTIPRSQWRFPDATHVELSAGFVPGKFYELVYEAQDPAIAGLGPAAVRDMISYLKYGGGPTIFPLADQRRFLKRAVGFGSSQSGRFLRTFLYSGFNRDEKDRQVFDGVWAHVAGAGRGSFNHRFAQPSRDGHPMLNSFYPTDIFPFTDLEQTDPETGERGGILVRARQEQVAPKMFYTNGSYEYWGRAASLIHTAADGSADAALPPGTRIYFLAGTQHGAGSFPPPKNGTLHRANPNDYRFVMRALLQAMHAWLKDSQEPPASRYPLMARRELVPLTAVAFPKVPGVALPRRPHGAWRVDYGPEFQSKGIVSIEPPKVGKPFPVLLPQTSLDGNEIAGVRLPEIAVPLATYSGWNLRAPSIGAPTEMYNMVGSWLPFARTKAEREKAHDPRPSIEELYPSREAYLEKTRAALRDLIVKGYVLEQDAAALEERARTLWDYAARAN